MLYQQFYSELGKLLYAIAHADQIISLQERKKLLEIVKSELVPVEAHKDYFDTNAAFYTEIEFDILDEQIAEPKAAFNSFLDFIEDHYSAFDERIISACVRVSKELAGAYRGTNKAEKKFIDILQRKVKELEKSKRVKKKQKA
jgi:hypothetical protein